MTPREKIDAAVDYLKKRGVRKEFRTTLAHRVLWLFSVPVPPPLFQGFLPLTLLLGGSCAALGLAAMFVVYTLVDGRLEEGLNRLQILGPVLVPVIFAIAALFATATRGYANSLDLPPWEEFEPTPDDSKGEW